MTNYCLIANNEGKDGKHGKGCFLPAIPAYKRRHYWVSSQKGRSGRSFLTCARPRVSKRQHYKRVPSRVYMHPSRASRASHATCHAGFIREGCFTRAFPYFPIKYKKWKRLFVVQTTLKTSMRGCEIFRRNFMVWLKNCTNPDYCKAWAAQRSRLALMSSKAMAKKYSQNHQIPANNADIGSGIVLGTVPV